MKAHYPWPQYRQAWTTAVEVSIDGTERPELVQDDQRRIRLDLAEGWTSAEISVGAMTTEAAFDGTDDTVVAVLSIGRTHTRTSQKLSVGTDWYSGVLRISVDELLGTGELSVLVLDTATSRVIGSSDVWAVIGDPGDAPPTPGAPPFEWKWEDFGESDAEIVREARSASRGAYSVVDVNQNPKPYVYLDSSVEGLQSILEASRPREERRRLQDLVGTVVARDISRAVFYSALDQCNDNEGVIELPEDQLRQQMLAAIAAELGMEEGAIALCESILSSAAAQKADRLALAEAAIDSLVAHGNAVARAAKEVI